MDRQRIQQILIFVIFGVALGFACIYPDNFLAPLIVLLILSSFFYYLPEIKNLFSKLLLTGFFFHLTAMWWLGPTMERFGGMPRFIAFTLMILHSFLSSLQFPLSYYLARKTEKIIDLRFSIIIFWVLLEQWFPRLFPWGLANFFINIRPVTAWGELIGVRGVSLIVLLLALGGSLIFKGNLTHFRKKIFGLSFFIFLLGFYLDYHALQSEAAAPTLRALVVQGNLSIEQKGQQEFLEVNLDKYRQLSSQQSNEKFDFVIWPESVASAWLNQENAFYSLENPDPLPDANTPLLYGGLSYLRYGGEARMYNSVLIREVGGKVSAPYSKKILMPFGEYVPLAKTFPWIRDLTPIKRDFSMGESLSPLKLHLAQNQSVLIGASVCYEDLSSELARSMASGGASVLVNLTNDAWYGDSPAPFQHDLLARFRAIETRKYFIRSTNTGLTTLINSRGQRVKNLPLFEEARSVFEFPTLSIPTFYVVYGNLGLYVLMIIVFVFGKLAQINKLKTNSNIDLRSANRSATK